MDKPAFFAAIRKAGPALFGTSLKQTQVDGIEAIVDEAATRAIPLRQLAYILATAFHETAHTMQPIEEYGKGKGREYGNRVPPYSKAYYGRGFVQLTWLGNYKRASTELAVDLVKYPERALEPHIAALIMFEGMIDGWFTGKKLSDYITPTKTDYISARRIINGTDRASIIAAYAVRFQDALEAGQYGTGVTSAPITAQPSPIDTPSIPVPQPIDTPSSAPWLVTILSTILTAMKGK